MKTVTIYTDGACSGNPGPGGWGAILRYKDTEKELSGGAADTTNNRMELTAVIEALDILKEPCVVERLQVRHRRSVQGLGKGLAEAGLDQVRQEACAEPRPVGAAAGPDGPPRDALSLGQGSRGE